MRYRWTKIYVSVLFVLMLLSGCGKGKALLYDSTKEESTVTDASLTDEAAGSGIEKELGTGEESSSSSIFVYVCGEVENPGVYELQEGDRLVDAIKAAGGMTEDASDTWLNLAEFVSDSQKIEVPSKEQAEEWVQAQKTEESGLVNLNTASASELMTLTGIGEAKAKEILNYREEHGGFESIEELMEISGIKEGIFQKIKDQITV